MKFFFFVFETSSGYICVSCKLRKGISLDDMKQKHQQTVDDEVRRFMQLEIYPKLYGRQMLQELLTAYPAGILNIVNGIGILPRKVAALIRNEDCHAVYFHPLKNHWYFASKLHKEVAEAQLGNP